MAFECDQCRRRFEDLPHISISGRRLCDTCNDSLLGATAGAVGGGVTTGIATAWWYSRLRKMGRKASGQPEEKPSEEQ